MVCDLCNGRGWIVSFNCDLEIEEIQKCDNCNIIKSDELANQKGLKYLKEVLLKKLRNNKKRLTKFKKEVNEELKK